MSTADAPGYGIAPTADPDIVRVTRTTERGTTSFTVHRDDADPEHRFPEYRLAAAWFGKMPEPTPDYITAWKEQNA